MRVGYANECMMKMDPNASWQNTGREAKLWIFNATTSFPILLFILNISFTTLIIVVLTMAMFFALNYYGYTVPVFIRFLRATIAGNRKEARPWWTK